MTSQRITWSRDKERTLLFAWLVALWSPMTYGIAVILGESTLMLADLLRRTSELLILFLSWFIYRNGRTRDVNATVFARWEQRINIMVMAVLLISFLIVILQAIKELRTPSPIGRVEMGIIISFLGTLVNGWFWRRHLLLARQEESLMFESQWRLFRSKTLLDGWVVIGLTATHYLQHLPWGRYLDPLGSLAMATVLLYSAIQIAQATRAKQKRLSKESL